MSENTSNCSVRNKHSKLRTNSNEAPPSIDITKDEFSRISDALKKPEFRKLFLDYCEEIQDPVNRQKYEDEIKQFEAERGVEVRFIKPEPGFVIKTSVDGIKKCFVNVAKSVEVAKPTNVASFNADTGARGLNWSIPMAQTAPRDDLDAHGKLCRVFDVVFHPDALHLAQRNAQFRKCLIETALDAVEREYKVKLDRTNLKFPKMQFKGMARPTVIRRLAKDPPAEANEPHPLDGIYPPKPTADAAEPKLIPQKAASEECPEFATPKYIIKHRRGVDLAEYTDEFDAKLNMTVPRELIVEIELPMLKSTAECQLDVTTKSLYLFSEKPGARYRLKLDLPYSVNDQDGAARFDIDKRRLCITLPVLRQPEERQRSMHEKLKHLHREDSGVESDVRDELNSNSGEDGVNEALDEKESEVSEANNDGGDFGGDKIAVSKTAAPTLTPTTFLKPSIHYNFPPKFDCNVLDSIMSFVLHVQNVDPSSIFTVETEKTAHVQFASVGAGFYPTYYAFFVKLPTETDFIIQSLSAEAWEINVVFNVNLRAINENVHSYFAGLDSNDLKTYAVQGNFQSQHSPRQRKTSPSVPLSSSLDISVERSDCEKLVEIEIKPRGEQVSSGCTANNTTEDEEMLQQKRKKFGKKHKKKNKKHRSLSETAYDDIKAYHKNQQELGQHQQQTGRCKNVTADEKVSKNDEELKSGMDSKPSSKSMAVPVSDLKTQQRFKHRSYSESRDSVASSSTGTSSFKGILKHYSRYDQRPSISGSNSSIEDCSCSTDAGAAGYIRFSQSFSDIPEENGNADLSESCKKTVRFNEVIKKQVFRLDSSILGQRKRNQKRRNQRQRALQRRLSEGDSADYEEMKSVSSNANTVNCFHQKNQQNKDHHSNNNNKHLNSNDNNPYIDSLIPNQHDSGVDLSNGEDFKMTSNKNASSRPRLESESSSDIDTNKNSMIFELDM